MNKEVNLEIAKLLHEKGFEGETLRNHVQIFEDTFKLVKCRMWLMDEESGFQNAPNHFRCGYVVI